MKILHIDTNHELMLQQLNALGFTNHENYTSPKTEIEAKIGSYDGVVIRSRFSIDKQFLDAAVNLKFIGRVGAGLENIDCAYAMQKGVHLISAPEGNRNAVGEHTLGMLLSLFNKLNTADAEVRAGKWLREENRGKAFAKKLRGFDVEVLCYDIKPNVGDANATQVSLKEFQKKVEVVSLHTPQTPLTLNMVNAKFINQFENPFWLLNTARGKSVVTQDLVTALKSGQILGAGLDVLEYEKKSFESLFAKEMPEAFQYLIKAENVLLSPHVAGWTVESKIKLAQTIVDKIKLKFC
jgi:D-3-phosphoglycerate dehydrogenase